MTVGIVGLTFKGNLLIMLAGDVIPDCITFPAPALMTKFPVLVLNAMNLPSGALIPAASKAFMSEIFLLPLIRHGESLEASTRPGVGRLGVILIVVLF